MKAHLTILATSLPFITLASDLKPGTNLVKLNHDGHPREILVRLPDNHESTKKYPVVFGFHGAGGPKEGYHRLLERLVSQHDFISVSPQGISNKRGITGWNGFSGHRISNTDDVGMVRKCIDHLDKTTSIDKSRLFATGGSSGAIFCFRLAMETDLFAAIAPMRGAMINRPPPPQARPHISILLVCGADDPLFKGGEQAPGEVFYSAHDSMRAWARNHGNHKVVRPHPQSGGVKLTHFSPEKSDYELLLYAVGGSGHRLGRKHMTKAIDYMGEFFLRHSKKRAAAPPSK
jgi:poly(3-hydroxybutyrate) depolymerase